MLGMYIGAKTMGNSMEVPGKFKIEILYDPAISLVGIYLGKTRHWFEKMYALLCLLRHYLL